MVSGGFEVTCRLPEGKLPILDSEILFRVYDMDLAIERIKIALKLMRACRDCWPRPEVQLFSLVRRDCHERADTEF